MGQGTRVEMGVSEDWQDLCGLQILRFGFFSVNCG